MNLFLVRRNGKVDYDQYDAFVVAADGHLEAREAAYEGAGGEHCWDNHSREFLTAPQASSTTVGLYTGPLKKPHVVLGSFRAA